MNGPATRCLASVILAVAVVLGSVSVCDAAVTIFLSDKGYGEGATLANPEWGLGGIPISLGETNSMYVWVRPDPNQGLIGVGLDVESDNTAVVEATAVTVFNADIWMDALNADSGDDRWNTPVGQGSAGDLATDMVGVAVDEVGIDPANNGQVAPFYYRDTLYDSGADAFLYAKIDFQLTAIQNTNFWIVVNSKRVAPKVGSSPDVDIIFGANEPTVLHGNDEYVRNVVPDGRIIISEPVTLSLLAVCGLALFRRRRK